MLAQPALERPVCSHMPAIQGVRMASTLQSTGMPLAPIQSISTPVLLENHELHVPQPLAGTQGASGVRVHAAWGYVLKAAVFPQSCCETSGVFLRGVMNISVCTCDGPMLTLQHSLGSCQEFFSPFCGSGLWLPQHSTVFLISTPSHSYSRQAVQRQPVGP